jgi:hypothetical protein
MFWNVFNDQILWKRNSQAWETNNLNVNKHFSSLFANAAKENNFNRCQSEKKETTLIDANQKKPT